MHFTQEDYRKIERWLLQNSIKDTQFSEALLPLEGSESISFVQNGKNVKIPIREIVNQLFLLGAQDFLNITDRFEAKNISLSQAIRLIPYKSRKIGQVITFLDEDNKWSICQFKGTTVNQWNNTGLWDDLGKASLLSGVVPDEEDLTGTQEGDKLVVSFKDKTYNAGNYSGLGKVYLRKNITQITDPATRRQVTVNLLTQNMFTREKTVYYLQYDYTLNGQTITIPEGSTLRLEGGSLKDGTIIFKDTLIELNSPAFNNVALRGSIRNEGISVEWFNEGSDSADLQAAVDASVELGFVKVKLASRVYNLSTPIIVRQGINLEGVSSPHYAQDLMEIAGFKQYNVGSLLKINSNTSAIRILGEKPTSSNYKIADIKISSVSFRGTVNYKGTGISFETYNAPSRVIMVKECNFFQLDRALSFTKSTDAGSMTTANAFMEICNNNVCYCNYGLYITGARTVLNMSFHDNNVEAINQCAIYSGPKLGNYVPLFSYIQIQNNDFESTANVAELNVECCTLDFIGNYFEGPLSITSTVKVRGNGGKMCATNIRGNMTTIFKDNMKWDIDGTALYMDSDVKDAKMLKVGSDVIIMQNNCEFYDSPVRCFGEFVERQVVSDSQVLNIPANKIEYPYNTTNYYRRINTDSSFTQTLDVPAGVTLNLWFNTYSEYSIMRPVELTLYDVVGAAETPLLTIWLHQGRYHYNLELKGLKAGEHILKAAFRVTKGVSARISNIFISYDEQINTKFPLVSYNHSIDTSDLDTSDVRNHTVVNSSNYGRLVKWQKYPEPIGGKDGEWTDIDGISLNTAGPASEKPVTNVPAGFVYMDTTLNAPVVWNGQSWTNVDGTIPTKVIIL